MFSYYCESLILRIDEWAFLQSIFILFALELSAEPWGAAEHDVIDGCFSYRGFIQFRRNVADIVFVTT